MTNRANLKTLPTKRSLQRIAEDRLIREKEERKARDYADWQEAARKIVALWSPERAMLEAKHDLAAYRDEQCGIERFYRGEDLKRNAEANPHYAAVLQEAPDVAAAIEHARATLKRVVLRPDLCN